MRRLSTLGLPSSPRNLFQLPSGIAAVLLVLLAAAVPSGVAQSNAPATPPAVDVLGAHGAGGRGCASCHTPHNDLADLGPGGAAENAAYAMWGSNAAPSYGETLALGYDGNYVEVPLAGSASGAQEVSGVLLCLSCHDGNLTPQNMMATRSYERKIGLLRNSAYDSRPVPTLLGEETSPVGGNGIDHPLGADTSIPSGNGLVFANGQFSVIPGSPYAQFVANYGWPSLAPRKRSTPYGIDAAGKPYVVCTTCHNQHLMSVYASTSTSPIAGDGGGRVYSTYFFANGPYNPNVEIVASTSAASTTQFCRQCHFAMSNEGNNATNIRTTLF